MCVAVYSLQSVPPFPCIPEGSRRKNQRHNMNSQEDIDNALWALVEPLLPPRPPRRLRYPGRLPVSDRAAFSGILFVLRTGIRWSGLPAEMGFGSGITCWRRFHKWQRAGVWDRLYDTLVEQRGLTQVGERRGDAGAEWIC